MNSTNPLLTPYPICLPGEETSAGGLGMMGQTIGIAILTIVGYGATYVAAKTSRNAYGVVKGTHGSVYREWIPFEKRDLCLRISVIFNMVVSGVLGLVMGVLTTALLYNKLSKADLFSDYLDSEADLPI